MTPVIATNDACLKKNYEIEINLPQDYL